MAQEWQERFDDFAYSEMTVQQWCDFNRVPVHKFYYWKRRLKSAHSAPPADVHFGSVSLTDEPAAPPAVPTLRIAGAEIDFVPGFNLFEHIPNLDRKNAEAVDRLLPWSAEMQA